MEVNTETLKQSSWYMTRKIGAHILCLNTLRLRQNGCHFSDNIFNCIFLNENAWNLIKIPMKFVPKYPVKNIPALVQIMAWRRPGDKPLWWPYDNQWWPSLPRHICITRLQWVNKVCINGEICYRGHVFPHVTHICIYFSVCVTHKSFHWSLVFDKDTEK